MKRKQAGLTGALIDILRTTGLTLADKDELGSLIGKEMDKIGKEAHRQHGFRIENMFAYVAGALGGCLLVKQEDGGACFVDEENIKISDYRVVLKNRDIFLAEVKNCTESSIQFKESYINSLHLYGDLKSKGIADMPSRSTINQKSRRK